MDYSKRHKCKKQCGACCRKIQSPGFWKQVELTDEQIELLQTERAKHPKEWLRPPSYAGPCDMLIGNICLIHKLLGWEFKPEGCKNYVCERNNTNDS